MLSLGRMTFIRLLITALLLYGCGVPLPTVLPDDGSEANLPEADQQTYIQEAPTPTATPTTQIRLAPASFGPNQQNFPPGFNPLTGLPVADPALLDLPALLISITHFPPQARPQGGLSFAPWVFEYLISTGSTRLLGVFYGQYPFQESPVIGDCLIRNEPFAREEIILGNRVWLDSNENGLQDAGEPGVGGVCVTLLDAISGNPLDETTTDSNGFFGFNVSAGKSYLLEFKAGKLQFSPENRANENQDSDASPETGRTDTVIVNYDDLLLDAGLLPPKNPTPAETQPPSTVGVGPVRSARLINIHIQNFFQDSCLIYAGSTLQIRDQIPGCAEVFKKGDGGVGSMLDIPRMIRISEDNARKRRSNFNYAHNLFEENVPAGGQPAGRLDVFVSQLNQSAWVYDASVQGWLRFVDDASRENAGVLHSDTDRLNGRQIYFENLIVLFAEHEVLAPAIIDMYLQQGESEKALLFRDGRMYEITWSTRAGEFEQQTGLRRPIAFLDKEGQPFPLRPGRTWILIATPFSQISEIIPGAYKLRVIAPEGAGIY